MEYDSPLRDAKPVFAARDHAIWEEIKPKNGKPGFEFSEFQRGEEMDVNFLRLLYKIRQKSKAPMRIISDARPPDADIGASKSAHKKRPCKAVDLKVKNAYERAQIVLAAVACGIVRIGIYPGDNADGGGLHLDAEVSADNKSPRIWTRY